MCKLQTHPIFKDFQGASLTPHMTSHTWGARAIVISARASHTDMGGSLWWGTTYIIVREQAHEIRSERHSPGPSTF